MGREWKGEGYEYRGARGRIAAPARAEWARAQSTREEKRAAREALRLSPAGNPLSRAAHGFSPTARGRGGSNVVKQVIQEGKKEEGPGGGRQYKV